MKVILAFVAILGLAAADDLSDLKTFLSCLHKAMTDGIPSVSLPQHDPLQIQDFTMPKELFMTANLTNNTLYGLLNYTFPVLDVAETSSKPDIVVYDYSIHWPRLTLTGKWEGDDFTPEMINGTYSIEFGHLTWSGKFNLTKPGQEGYNGTVNNLTIYSHLENVDVKLLGLGNQDELMELSFQTYFMNSLNNISDSVAKLLLSRFNEFWIGHPEKIQAILEYCGLTN